MDADCISDTPYCSFHFKIPISVVIFILTTRLLGNKRNVQHFVITQLFIYRLVSLRSRTIPWDVCMTPLGAGVCERPVHA